MSVFTFFFQFFLAVANYGTSREKETKSAIYRWSKRRKRFRLHQEIATWTARDLEYFEIEGAHYLAVANHAKGKKPRPLICLHVFTY